jgi:hypothetical protein
MLLPPPAVESTADDRAKQHRIESLKEELARLEKQ